MLVSGDPGCFSLAGSVIRRFGLRRCRVLPGISSVQLAFARVGQPWHDAVLVSLHGRNATIEPQELIGRDRIAFFLDGGNTTLSLVEALGRAEPTGYHWVLMEDLCWPTERVTPVEPASLHERPRSSRSLLLRLREGLS